MAQGPARGGPRQAPGPDAAGWRPAPGPRLGRVEQSGPKVCEAPRVFRPYRSLAALVRDSLEGDFHGISLWPDGHGRAR